MQLEGATEQRPDRENQASNSDQSPMPRGQPLANVYRFNGLVSIDVYGGLLVCARHGGSV
jgi:hypothetical protein